MPTTSTETRTQLRAICPACFAQQAVNARGRLAQHGYRRPQGWMQNVNNCAGAGHPHFGLEAGRAITLRVAGDLREQALRLRADAVKTETGALPVREKRTGKVIEAPLPWQVTAAIENFVRAAAMRDRAANDLEARAAQWTPAEPVEVTVEKKGAPLLHWRGGYWKDGRACAGSRMAAYKGAATTVRADVTCPKCIARFARYPEAQ